MTRRASAVAAVGRPGKGMVEAAPCCPARPVFRVVLGGATPHSTGPARPRNPPAGALPAEHPGDPLVGRAALVVDDEPMIREILTEHCAFLGMAVREAADGTAALTVLEERPEIEMLVTDVRMPGLDGPTLAERALSLRPGIKVIFVTGYTTYRSLAWPVLRKPFDLDELEAALRQALA